ncbi:MAG: hypothetical protein EZS28_016948 [Streblomastix strix]|uniref:Uncharacterized protein n=1 Tax=Streblomastix strix TaxID=222440 RepID=A0A5J4VXY6_9EUKA|nr:MAG: hypothetical protein EZS28_016948 [Streblomastix strix]
MCFVRIVIWRGDYSYKQCGQISRLLIEPSMHSYINKRQQEQQPKFKAVQVPRGPIPHSSLGQCLKNIKVKGKTFTLSTNKSSPIQFNPVVKKGIMRFEVLNVDYLQRVGIADESVQFDGDDQFPTS